MSRRATPRQPRLRRLFGAYLHEDYAAEGGSPMDAVRRYAGDVAREEREAAAREVDRLLASTKSDRTLDRALARLRCAYDPTAHGASARSFLEEVAATLRAP